MRKTKYAVKYTAQFKKDYKLAIKAQPEKSAFWRKLLPLLRWVNHFLIKNKDHALTGNWVGIGNVTFCRTGC